MPSLRLSRKTIVIVAIALVLLAIGAWFFVRGVNIGALRDEVMGFIQQQGPWVFFIAMALLPAAGFPMLAFTVTAGAAFSAKMGTLGVILCCVAAVLANITLTYWLARYALRPIFERLVERMGHKIPQVSPDEQGEVIVLLRITPGPPFFLQNYILGMAEVNFFKYVWITLLVHIFQIVAFTIFGQSFMNGRGALAVTGIGLLAGATIVIHLVRRHLTDRKKTASGSDPAP
ncbi:MAG TPA: VTT domain-containing protein [Opitutaceae bacterium]|nr:VTT domain-containing protein [Opitutaceae bacterium]